MIKIHGSSKEQLEFLGFASETKEELLHRRELIKDLLKICFPITEEPLKNELASIRKKLKEWYDVDENSV